jgi:hypothetical protein
LALGKSGTLSRKEVTTRIGSNFQFETNVGGKSVQGLNQASCNLVSNIFDPQPLQSKFLKFNP